jgi:hypothetical protein
VNSDSKIAVAGIAAIALITMVGGGAMAYVGYRKDMACIERSGVTCDQAMKRCPEGKP